MTVNLPDKLTAPVKNAVLQWRYEGLSELCVALVLWDIYSRQRHLTTGPLIQQPQWAIDRYVDALLAKIGHSDPRVNVGPHRFTVRVPKALYPLAIKRKEEERYRSDSAYIVGLIVFALDPDVPAERAIPHQRLSLLMREPARIRTAVFARLADDFGDPARQWPHGIVEQIDQLVADQRQLHLPL